LVAGPHAEDDASEETDFAAPENETTAVAELELTSTTKEAYGPGTFQTYVPGGRAYGVMGKRAARGRRKHPNQSISHPLLIYPPPLSPTQAVLKRWYSFLQFVNPANPVPGVLGWWLEELPLFLDDSPATESALKTVLDTAVCRVTATPENVAEALRENNRTLVKIRTVIAGDDAEKIQNEALFAIILLNFAEVRV
jgi:hypothetical protein